ncbi:MAG: HAD hydrolase-like protein [Cyanobacteria bacterium P01_H01_bin.105]
MDSRALPNQTVYFDLDGTLLDPKIGITTSIQYALEQLGCDVLPKDELTWCIGPPLLHSFCSLVGAKQAEQAVVLYRERFATVGWKENVPYSGIKETLRTLVDQGLILYVATSKPSVYAEKIIDYFELRPYFSRVFGSELDGTRANKAELLQFALSETNPAAEPTMIGDRKHDMIGALANGMKTIGVTYGYGSVPELEQAGAMKLANRPEDLLVELL